MWAAAGFCVATCWILYAFATAPRTNEHMQGIWTLATVTCPAIVAGSYYPLSLSWVLLANAAIYALVGLMAETLRRNHT